MEPNQTTVQIQPVTTNQPDPMEPTVPSTPEQKTPAFSRSLALSALCVLTVLLGGITFAASYYGKMQEPRPAAHPAAAAAPIITAYDTIHLQAKSAIVVDLVTHRDLYERNADAQLPLASLTKVPLALVVSESMGPDTKITIPADTSPPGSTERLAKGQVWRLQDIIDFTLVASSNAGAEILAAAANQSVHQKFPLAPLDSATIWRMNDLVKSLGLTSTYFLNPSGLDISTTQSGAYGTARDMALLFAYAHENYQSVFAGTTHDNLLLTDDDGSQTKAYNTNEALGAIPGLIMGKTGYTDLAGGNLAIVFDVGLAHPVVAVVLGSTQEGRFEDMKTLVDATARAISQE